MSLPLGSIGTRVEGECRHLVKDRLPDREVVDGGGAKAMLQMRASYLNDQWEESLEH
jgi:hypothetical protein